MFTGKKDDSMILQIFIKFYEKHSQYVVELETKLLELLMHSPEVELTEIFVSNIFDGNGLAPSDKPTDTKTTTRGVQNFQILKIL